VGSYPVWVATLHSSVPSVHCSSGLRDPAAAIYTIPLSHSGELPSFEPCLVSLHVSCARHSVLQDTARTVLQDTARTSPCTEPRFEEPTRSCFLLAFYTKLSQSSTRVWPVILTSVRSPDGGETLRGSKDKRASSARPYLLQTNTMKTL